MKTSIKTTLTGPVAHLKLVTLEMPVWTSFTYLTLLVKLASSSLLKPFILQMDNDAAHIVANDTCFRSRMKHNDCGREGVRILRDKSICLPTWVSTHDDLADIFTKYFL